MRTPILLASMILFAGCNAAAGERDHDDGSAETRRYELAGFDGVVLGGSDDVHITQGKDFSVSATGPARTLERLDLRVEDGTLRVGRKRAKNEVFSWGGTRSARIDVTLPELRRARLAGSGDMRASGTAADRFEGGIAGSGNLAVDGIRAEKVELNIAGSGDLTARGKAGSAELSIAGSGSIDASGLAAKTLDASTAGSGSIRAAATIGASARTIGSGDIEIAGIDSCKVTKMGSGSVRCTGRMRPE